VEQQLTSQQNYRSVGLRNERPVFHSQHRPCYFFFHHLLQSSCVIGVGSHYLAVKSLEDKTVYCRQQENAKHNSQVVSSYHRHHTAQYFKQMTWRLNPWRSSNSHNAGTHSLHFCLCVMRQNGVFYAHFERQPLFSIHAPNKTDRDSVGDSLRVGRSGDRIPVRARFSVSVRTGPKTHTAFYQMGARSSPWWGGRGMASITDPRLALRLSKSIAIRVLPFCAFVQVTGWHLSFTFMCRPKLLDSIFRFTRTHICQCIRTANGPPGLRSIYELHRDADRETWCSASLTPSSLSSQRCVTLYKFP